MARNSSSTSAYAQYETSHNVKGIGTYVPRDLYDLMQKARPDTADGAIIKEALVLLVNSVPGLTVDGYVLPENRKESKAAKAEREAREIREELAKAKEEIATLKAQITPTPPTVMANATTGKIEAK